MSSIRTLALRNVTLLGHEGEKVFENLTCELPANANVWVRAASGGGKSQLLQLLGGIEEPEEGSLLFNGLDMTALDFAAFSPWQRQIGFAFEVGGLLSNRTLEQNLLLPFLYHKSLSVGEAQRRVDEYLEHFGLSRYRDRRPAACSGGSRKAAGLARALITRPELLLLDHPTAGLDERAIRKLAELIELHRREHGLRHVFIAGEDEALVRGLRGHVKLDLSELRAESSRKEAA